MMVVVVVVKEEEEDWQWQILSRVKAMSPCATNKASGYVCGELRITANTFTIFDYGSHFGHVLCWTLLTFGKVFIGISNDLAVIEITSIVGSGHWISVLINKVFTTVRWLSAHVKCHQHGLNTQAIINRPLSVCSQLNVLLHLSPLTQTGNRQSN